MRDKAQRARESAALKVYNTTVPKELQDRIDAAATVAETAADEASKALWEMVYKSEMLRLITSEEMTTVKEATDALLEVTLAPYPNVKRLMLG